nr:four-jointed box protein 1 [Zootoca vivipara]
MRRAGLAGLGFVAGLWLVALAGLWSGRGAREPGVEAASSGRLLRPPSEAAQKTFRALLTLPGQPSEGPGESGQEPPPPPVPADPPRGVAEPPVRGGIFWSRALEAQVPSGFSAEEAASWVRAAREARVLSLERGGCGRSSNRLARLSDGSRACVRYGINAEQIQGEALSYHLAGLLGIQERLPPLALARVEARGGQWAPLRGLSQAQLVELVQWSDLIVFDYVTANFDRLVSNLFSLQWDPRVMQRATSNLHRAPNGGLVFLDNEAGLVHGYRLLAMWDKYNEPLLRSVCVFREATAQRVRELHRARNAAAELLHLYRTREPLASVLGFLSEQQAQLLQDRVDFVHKHILHCKAKAASL